MTFTGHKHNFNQRLVTRLSATRERLKFMERKISESQEMLTTFLKSECGGIIPAQIIPELNALESLRLTIKANQRNIEGFIENKDYLAIIHKERQ